VKIEARPLMDYLLPMLEPVTCEQFTFSRGWLRKEAVRLSDWRSPAAQLGRQLNLPPSYLLIHRVTLGAVGILCQLGSTAPFRAEMEWWQPGFAEPGTPAADHAAEANRVGRHLPELAVEEDVGTLRTRPGPAVFDGLGDPFAPVETPTGGVARTVATAPRQRWPQTAPAGPGMPTKPT
jgi:hypothetical protein